MVVDFTKSKENTKFIELSTGFLKNPWEIKNWKNPRIAFPRREKKNTKILLESKIKKKLYRHNCQYRLFAINKSNITNNIININIHVYSAV